MREHEVPTHVQAEDKVLLWFTFPQIVAVVATCAVAYGVYRYFPFGPSGLKLGIAVLLGVLGLAAVVGKVGRTGSAAGGRRPLEIQAGGQAIRRLPRTARRQRASPRSRRPGPTRCRLLAKKAAGKLGNAVRAAQAPGPQALPASQLVRQRPTLQKTPTPTVPEYRPREIVKHRKPWSRFLAVSAVGALAVLALVLLPNIALADDPDEEPEEEPPYGDAWRLDEIYFVPPVPVPGRRVFIEGLAVTANHANVTLRAAHELHLRGRAYGGRSGRTLRMGFNTPMSAGQSKSYNMSLDGPIPVIHFLLGGRIGPQRGGVPEEQPDPLPPALCRRRAVRPGNDLPGVDARAASPASSPRSASRRRARRWTCRCTPATSASRCRPCRTPP